MERKVPGKRCGNGLDTRARKFEVVSLEYLKLL